MFVLNTSRPLFRNNPKLRQAVNFAVDRAALAREHGGNLVVTPTDQYLMPNKLGFRDERIYPLRGPDLEKARKLARGRTRNGRAVLFVPDIPAVIARAQLIQRNVQAIGLEVEIKRFSPGAYFPMLGTPGFDIAYAGLLDRNPDPAVFLSGMFDGRTIGRSGFVNWSYFNSARYNRLLDQASRLVGARRYRASGELDVQLSRDAAPAIPYAYDNALTLVSARTGCVIVNPYLDLAAVCLK
jgi:ABC-type transport system substrate-binding protein